MMHPIFILYKWVGSSKEPFYLVVVREGEFEVYDVCPQLFVDKGGAGTFCLLGSSQPSITPPSISCRICLL
ncbi:MAG: hypothetical protein QW756_07905, partial [Nitrososphaerota archaeon]